MTNKQLNQLFSMIKTMLAIFIAMVLAFLLILLVSNEPLEAIKAFILGPFTSIRRFGNMIEFFIPVAFTALGVCIMFSIGMSSVIGEGTVFFGGLLAAWVAISMGFIGGVAQFSSFFVAAIVCGLIAMIPMILKLKYDADLFVGSLMLNYVLLYLGLYILNYVIRDPQVGMAASYEIADATMLGILVKGTKIHTGFIIVIVAIVLGYLFLDKTHWGYQMKLVGSNPKFARYSGVNITKMCLLASFIGGALSGLGGAVEILGRNQRFQWMGLPGFGWDGILIATIAGFKPKFVPIAALFIAYIRTGADIMNRSSDVASELVIVIQSFMILLIAAKGFLSGTHQKLLVKNVKAKANSQAVNKGNGVDA